MLKAKWIVSWTLNDWNHAKSFKEYDKAMRLYYQLESYGYNPSIHQE